MGNAGTWRSDTDIQLEPVKGWHRSAAARTRERRLVDLSWVVTEHCSSSRARSRGSHIRRVSALELDDIQNSALRA